MSTLIQSHSELDHFSPFLKTGDMFTYDAVFRIPEDYDQYLPRCDRRHAKGRGLKIYEELLKTPRLALALSYPEDFQVTRHMQVKVRGKRQILSCIVQDVL
uniref:Uncharacterized protein n=1 Tax=Malurus cyaneus samueli TaxID=2593467 RepID=A0A8C5X0N6_9PASS